MADSAPLPNAVYHVVYHDVANTASSFTHWMRATVSPDDLRAQLSELARIGDFGDPRTADPAHGPKPTFMIGFDDEYRGVAQYAAEICEEFGIRASVAVNSAFVLREERFWRCELSHLLETHELEPIAEALGIANNEDRNALWIAALQSFYSELRKDLAACFETHCADAAAALEARFMDDTELRDLVGRGWALTNHSATHPAAGAFTPPAHMLADFERGAVAVAALGGRADHWVLPFDHGPVKRAIDQHREVYVAACDRLYRADPTNVGDETGRVQMGPGSSAVKYLHRARAMQDGSAPWPQRLARGLRRRMAKRGDRPGGARP